MKLPVERIEAFTVPAKDDAGKPVMKSVWLDVVGSRMLATDGHVAMRVAVEVGEEDISGCIPLEAFELGRKELKEIIKLQGKDQIPDPWLKIVCGDETIFIENLLTNTRHLVSRPKLMASEKFPDIDGAFPELKAPASVCLGLDILASVAKNIDPQGFGVILFVISPDKAVVMATPTGKGSMVVMPMKSDVDFQLINARALPVEAEDLTAEPTLATN